MGFLATYLRPTTFVLGETIYERGERGDEMYFVVDGVVALHTTPGTSLPSEPGGGTRKQQPPQEQQQHRPEGGSDNMGGVHQLEQTLPRERIAAKGDVFGESCLLPDEVGHHRRERASAVSTVSAYVLKAASLQDIAEEYPEVRSLQSNCCTLQRQ
jgi:CRP-like cAMP-binding protein